MALTFNSDKKSSERGYIVEQKAIFCINNETLYDDDVT